MADLEVPPFFFETSIMNYGIINYYGDSYQ